MCDWAGRLPADADAFLWDPAGPVWTFPGGPAELAPEASRIVFATILSRPWAVTRAALDNSLAQLVMLRLDHVLGGNALDATVGVRLRDHYPVAERERFEASAQRADKLHAVAAPWQTPHMVLLVLGAIGSAVLMVRSWRRDPAMLVLIALIAVGVLSNAFATGALSGPHDRYQARIAWLMLLPPVVFAMSRLKRGVGFPDNRPRGSGSSRRTFVD
jgi:hypothetical protein